jgi:catechol 2,3-dioxygenase-like lactoylglutathione lyase family enzyme
MSSTSSAEAAADTTSLQNLTSLKPRVLHVAYHVADIDRALAFYVGVLGMQEQMRLPLGNNLQEVILGFPKSPGAGVILMWNTEDKSPRKLGAGYSRFVLHVSDVEAALKHLEKHDTRVVTPLTTVGSFKYAMVQDPDGYVIELLHVAAS